MDFARKQLEKYGWTDGKGLGKNENGIAEPIKPKLKRSVAGIGHDAAADFTEFWWSKLYDKAAKNVEVKEKNGKTKKIKTKEAEFKITNSTYQLTKSDTNVSEKEEYSDFFVKTIVLTNGGTQERLKEELEEREEKTRDVFQLTEEELFAACEGRTAHKGARHGLRATGKLARIERQEKELLIQDKYTGYSHSKKIKKNKSDPELDLDQKDSNLIEDTDEISKKKKKNRSKRNEKSNENNSNAPEIDIVEEDENMLKKIDRISKKKKNKSICNENNSTISEHDLVQEDTNLIEEIDRISKKKKNKSKCKEKSSKNSLSASELDLVVEDTNLIEERDRISKNKKKKTRCKNNLTENDIGTELEMVELNTNAHIEGIIENIDDSINLEVKKKNKRSKGVTDVTEVVTEKEKLSSANNSENIEDYCQEIGGTPLKKRKKREAKEIALEKEETVIIKKNKTEVGTRCRESKKDKKPTRN